MSRILYIKKYENIRQTWIDKSKTHRIGFFGRFDQKLRRVPKYGSPIVFELGLPIVFKLGLPIVAWRRVEVNYEHRYQETRAKRIRRRKKLVPNDSIKSPRSRIPEGN
ncbi:unnamed protein product [Schistosoma bovis]|nr:unnamed protein product [Schistosoma bovis]